MESLLHTWLVGIAILVDELMVTFDNNRPQKESDILSIAAGDRWLKDGLESLESQHVSACKSLHDAAARSTNRSAAYSWIDQ